MSPRPPDAPRRTGGARHDSSRAGTQHLDPGIPRHRVDLDPPRVARAARAIVDGRTALADPDEDGIYGIRSFSGEEVYTVTVRPVLSCECADAVYRGNVCKHICACLLFEKDQEAVDIAKWVDFLPD